MKNKAEVVRKWYYDTEKGLTFCTAKDNWSWWRGNFLTFLDAGEPELSYCARQIISLTEKEEEWLWTGERLKHLCGLSFSWSEVKPYDFINHLFVSGSVSIFHGDFLNGGSFLTDFEDRTIALELGKLKKKVIRRNTETNKTICEEVLRGTACKTTEVEEDHW